MSTTAEASCPPIDSRTGDLLFRNAHTAYSFTDQPVTDEQLEEIYDLVRYAPTAMNSQPLRITFLRTEAAKARLMPHLAAGNRRKSESALVVAILAADTDFHENLARVLPQVPDARHRFADDDARVKSAMFNSALQAGYFVIAARAVGLDVGPMAGFDQAGLDAEFFAGTALRSFLVVNLGYVSESGNNPRNPRLAHHEAVSIL